MERNIKIQEKAAERLRRAVTNLPNNIHISRRAERDLDKISDEDAARILEDIARVATGKFPGEVKRISTLPSRPLQADAGLFRFLFRWNNNIVEVIAVFPKAFQQSVFRGLK